MRMSLLLSPSGAASEVNLIGSLADFRSYLYHAMHKKRSLEADGFNQFYLVP